MIVWLNVAEMVVLLSKFLSDVSEVAFDTWACERYARDGGARERREACSSEENGCDGRDDHRNLRELPVYQTVHGIEPIR